MHAATPSYEFNLLKNGVITDDRSDLAIRRDSEQALRFIAWAARVVEGPPETMTFTLRPTSSAARLGRRSALPSADRHSMVRFFPSTYPSSRRP